MNVIINVLVLFFCFGVGAKELLKRNVDVEYLESDWNPPVNYQPGDHGGSRMNSTVYMSVNHYHCIVDEIEDAVLILYGTKSWTFPVQDVNLTLSYPSSTNSNSDFSSSEDDGHIITGYKVILYIDSMEAKGYIMSGGVLQDSIMLSFVSKNIRSLSYQFWLYGLPKNTIPQGLISELYTHLILC